MKYQIKVIHQAEKDLDALDSRYFEPVKKKIISLVETPRPFGCQKLTNEDGYRIRSGDFWILYRIDDKAKEVIVYRIKHRKEAYLA
ncbi:MAG: type II toxin-antitoxin system RelE/ParE family toxin [Candidatus Omnitrophica bacterium]|nr:type II toxin-antitoxin system RelE/ParE family toxin [Candidatus Omnitrophota bacterium]